MNLRRQSDRADADELDAFADFVFRATPEHPGGVPWMRTLRGWIAAYRAERDAVPVWKKIAAMAEDPDNLPLDHAFVGSVSEDACLYRTFDDGGNATSLFCGLPLGRHER